MLSLFRIGIVCLLLLAAAGSSLAATFTTQAEVRLLDASSKATQQTSRITARQARAHELVFIDKRVENYRLFIDDLVRQDDATRQFEVFLLNPYRDGVAQIGHVLQGRSDISAIHLITHGDAGELQIGNVRLNGGNLNGHAIAIRSWSAALLPGADLLVYGCNVASNADGRALVQALSRLTGADVAASTDLTGQSALGGNWTLEYATGRIKTRLAIDAAAQEAWTGTLAITQDNVSSALTAASSTTLTFAHTIGIGSNGILLVEVAIKGANPVTSVTYGGTALTLVGSLNDPANQVRSELWYLKAPTAGTANIVVTLPSVKMFVAGGTSFFGVDQTTPLGTAATANGSGGSPTVTVASSAGELVIDAPAVHAASSATVGAGQTQLWGQRTGTAGGDVWGGSSSEAGAASVVMSWTTSGSGAGEWATIAVPLKPAASTFSVSGTVYEDVNYGGGAGRDRASSSGVVRSGARVELYGSAGAYVIAVTTDGSGNYSFTGLTPGNYTVRVVSSSVTSSRTGYVAGLLPVMTYRTNASSGTAVAVTDYVGGQDQATGDAGNAAVGWTLTPATGVFSGSGSGKAHAFAPVTVSGANVTGVDFGWNFDTIANITTAARARYGSSSPTQIHSVVTPRWLSPAGGRERERGLHDQQRDGRRGSALLDQLFFGR